MKVGIYITGLGQSFVNETVEKYASRLTNEICINTRGDDYEIKSEKVNYSKSRQSTVVSICKKGSPSVVVYKLYDFKYHELLTEKFNSFSLIKKNFYLIILVLRKMPMIFFRLFQPKSYNRPIQTLYLFLILLTIASFILLLLPATISIILNTDGITTALKETLEIISKIVVLVTSFLLLIIPNANVLVASLASEFVCANDYLEHGMQKQLILGNLELMIDHISEHEKDVKIHFHTYSFGTIIALDYICPHDTKILNEKKRDSLCEALITIGTPLEFINAYYPQFFLNRNLKLGNALLWLNIYSIEDALATNFRKDSKIGDAEFGIQHDSKPPINVNYEIRAIKKFGIVDFIFLHSIKAHALYWDPNTEGQSCLKLIYFEMVNKKLLIT